MRSNILTRVPTENQSFRPGGHFGEAQGEQFSMTYWTSRQTHGVGTGEGEKKKGTGPDAGGCGLLEALLLDDEAGADKEAGGEREHQALDIIRRHARVPPSPARGGSGRGYVHGARWGYDAHQSHRGEDDEEGARGALGGVMRRGGGDNVRAVALPCRLFSSPHRGAGEAGRWSVWWRGRGEMGWLPPRSSALLFLPFFQSGPQAPYFSPNKQKVVNFLQFPPFSLLLYISTRLPRSRFIPILI